MSICIFECFLFEERLRTILGSLYSTLRIQKVGNPERDTAHGRAICQVNVKVFDVEDPRMRGDIKKAFISDGWACMLDDPQGDRKRMVFEPHPLPDMPNCDWYIKALVSSRLMLPH